MVAMQSVTHGRIARLAYNRNVLRCRSIPRRRPGRRVVRGACPHDCPDTCAMLVTVEDGRAIEMRGARRPSADAGRAVHEGRALSRPHVLRPARAASDAPRRPQGRGALRAHRLGRGARHDRGALPRASRRRRRAPRRSCPTATRATWACCSTPRWTGASSTGSARALLDRTICASAGKAGWAAVIGAVGGHGRRALRRQQADPDLGQQRDHVEPALLDARAGSQAARREARRDRSRTAARPPRSATSTSR